MSEMVTKRYSINIFTYLSKYSGQWIVPIHLAWLNLIHEDIKLIIVVQQKSHGISFPYWTELENQ